jgi:capsular polysaccharide biosynthesis protein
MRAAGTDAVGALRWGLRRYSLLFAACLVLGAVVAPVWVEHRDVPVDATALVIAQRLDVNLSALPRYGESVFDNGQVAQAVTAQFGAGGQARDVVPDRVSVVAEQDSIVFQVVGHDRDPKTAAAIANTAANTFVKELNVPGVGVGLFALQSPAEPPTAPPARLSYWVTVPVGVVAGLVLGLALVSFCLVARRPVLDAADAEEATGVPALGTVRVPRTRRGMYAPPDEFDGLVPVCRRLMALPTTTVVMVSRRREQRVRRQLSVALISVLKHIRDVRFVFPAELAGTTADRTEADRRPSRSELSHTGSPARLTFIDSSEPLDLVQPPQSTATVLVVPRGIGATALRAAVTEHLGGSAESRLLLVRRGRRSRGAPTATLDTVQAPEPTEVEALAGTDSR